MKECTQQAIDLWPLFWVALVFGIAGYHGLIIWTQYKLRMHDKELLEYTDD